MLTQDQLEQVRFPVGGIDKSETRRIAADLSLRTANKPESQDICFVGSGDYRAFIRSQSPQVEQPGPIVDESGAVVGEHRGIVDVTIGQRRGLNVAVGEPRYVTDIVPSTNTVVIGRREELARTESNLREVTTVSGGPLPRRVLAQYRAHGEAVPASVFEGDRPLVRFDQPQFALAPGQTIAFYEGEAVLGGAIID
jgi:tRNA-specific 2-thiouridylase